MQSSLSLFNRAYLDISCVIYTFISCFELLFLFFTGGGFHCLNLDRFRGGTAPLSRSLYSVQKEEHPLSPHFIAAH